MTLASSAHAAGPIGVFDSGYGGLTILREIRRHLPGFDYVYLGDNARAPYGTRSFDIVYDFTLQAVRHLFDLGCRLVILACNTASAKALRSIQQNDLPRIDSARRVLGVIRPTVEALASCQTDAHVCVLATPGTVASRSYSLEIAKLYPGMTVAEKPCPLWVPLIENGEADSPATRYFIDKYIGQALDADPEISTFILGCTHYPILLPELRRRIPRHIDIICQGDIVARSLDDYLRRHPEISNCCSTGGSCTFLTTENADKFAGLASLFLGHQVAASRIALQ